MTDSDLGCSGRLVLVVDDDRDIRSFIQIALTDAGHEVVEAGNGAVALELVRARPPDLILLNVLMPVMNGFGFATRYRRTAEPHAPIVCMTASPRAVEWCELAEADAVLLKPFSIAELQTIVGRFLDLPSPVIRSDPNDVPGDYDLAGTS